MGYKDLNDHNWFKRGTFWLDPFEPWEVYWYAMDANNKFDLISNTMRKIIVDEDTSPWAHQALEACEDLLKSRRRWPKSMDHDYDPKYIFEMWLYNFLWKLKLVWLPKKHGHKNRMSRDPFINFYVACTCLGETERIKGVTIPFKTSRPNVYFWRRYLITGKGLGWFRFFSWFTFSKKGYVLGQHEIMDLAIKNVQADKDKVLPV